MISARRILVLGGTGFVGRSLCERLVEHDSSIRVTVATRHLAHAKAIQFLPTIDPIECNVHDDRELTQLVAGHDAIVNLIAILHGSAADFNKVHVQLAQRLAQACAKTGVRRLLHVSALGVGPDAPSNYLRSKHEAEKILSSASLDLTMLRPSVIFGAGDSFLNLFAALLSVAPVMPLTGVDARFQPVWVEDVSEAIVRCLGQLDCIGKTYECGGPQIFTLRELVQLAGKLSGHQRPVFALPESLGTLQAAALELMPGTPLVSRDNILSMRVPNVATDALPGLRDLGIGPSSLLAVAPSYLSPGQGVARFNFWR